MTDVCYELRKSGSLRETTCSILANVFSSLSVLYGQRFPFY